MKEINLPGLTQAFQRTISPLITTVCHRQSLGVHTQIYSFTTGLITSFISQPRMTFLKLKSKKLPPLPSGGVLFFIIRIKKSRILAFFYKTDKKCIHFFINPLEKIAFVLYNNYNNKICERSLVVKLRLPKPLLWVRFPSFAPLKSNFLGVLCIGIFSKGYSIYCFRYLA